tara:strand:- start:287 stop:553 length:267 start_codon:yes stop_codon:yes gene_type:complete
MSNLKVKLRYNDETVKNDYTINGNIIDLKITESQRLGFVKVLQNFYVKNESEYNLKIEKINKHLNIVLSNEEELKAFYIGACGSIESI